MSSQRFAEIRRDSPIRSDDWPSKSRAHSRQAHSTTSRQSPVARTTRSASLDYSSRHIAPLNWPRHEQAAKSTHKTRNTHTQTRRHTQTRFTRSRRPRRAHTRQATASELAANRKRKRKLNKPNKLTKQAHQTSPQFKPAIQAHNSSTQFKLQSSIVEPEFESRADSSSQ